MNRSDSNAVFTRERLLTLVLALLTLIVIYVNYRIVEPFIPAVAFALALAVATRTPYAWLLRRLRGRQTAAAAIAVVLVAMLIFVPAVLLITYMVQTAVDNVSSLQAGGAVDSFRQKLESQPWFGAWARDLLDRIRPEQQIGNIGRALASQASSLLSGSVTFVTQLGITLFVLFFFYRDRNPAIRALRKMLPLSDSEADRLFSRVSETINATVSGSITIALIQATLAGIVYILLGVPLGLLWAAVTFLMALVPVLGTLVVWSPIALWLALSGHTTKALILVAWGTLVVGTVDNLLYPHLVGGKLHLHTVLTFFSVLGGISLFGPVGLILGPMAIAVAVALSDVWFERTEHGRAADEPLIEKGSLVGELPGSKFTNSL